MHHSVAIYDKLLQIEKCIERLRKEYKSCNNVISEQICTFVASVALFMSAKYLEIKYPVVEDVCKLMQCPFTFDEFIEMERVILEIFEWNLQLPTCVEIMTTFLSQGIIFSNDKIIRTVKEENKENGGDRVIDLTGEDL